MKVLQINSVCMSGSTGKIAYALHSSLIRDKYHSGICYGRGARISDKNCLRINNNVNVYFDVLATRITGMVGHFSSIATRRLIRKIEYLKPDVIHLHNIHGYYLNIPMLIKYLKKNKLPTVWTLHDEFMFTGKCGTSINCIKWMSSCKNCPQLSKYPASWLFDCTSFLQSEKKKLLDGFDRVIFVCPSLWLANRVKKSFLGTKTIKVINNAIDLDKVFLPREADGLGRRLRVIGKKVILSVAPNIMSTQKGGRYILEAAAALAEKRKEIVFIIIGLNEGESVAGENVIGIKRTKNQTELALYYSLADVFLICSEQETFPTVCLEALACGTPVVGFDAGGTKETVPSNLGQFVESGNINELVKAITSQVDQGKRSIECRNYALSHYLINDMYSKYLATYQECLTNYMGGLR